MFRPSLLTLSTTLAFFSYLNFDQYHETAVSAQHFINQPIPLQTIVPLNATPGHVVYRFQARSDNPNNQRNITYVIVSDRAGGRFEVDARSGEVRTRGSEPFLLNQEYSIDVRADEQARSGSEVVSLSIVAGKRKPQFMLPQYSTSIPKDSKKDLEIIEIKAKSFAGREIRYSLIEKNNVSGVFVIDPVSGKIRLAKDLDFEDPRQPKSYMILVNASEEPDGLVASVDVTIGINDVNDNATRFESPDHLVHNISEDAKISARAANISASEIDSSLVSSTTSAPSTTTSTTTSSTTSSPSTSTTSTTTTTPSTTSTNTPSASPSSSPSPSPTATSTTASPISNLFSTTHNPTSNRRPSTNPSTASRASSPSSPVQFIKPKSKFKCVNNTDCNNGMCDIPFGICFCRPGFTGETCAIEIDECRQFVEPCLNNGTCVDAIAHYTCECQPGFRGDQCQESIDMCDGTPCANGGKCINHRTSYTCQCSPGWEGKHCESNIDECQLNPCQNNGTCHDLINGYRCDCGQSGFVGKNCEIDFDDCASKPCGIAAKECIDLTGDFKCICHDGFEGKRCDEDIDECQFNKCENNGTCIQNSIILHNLNGNNSLPIDLTTAYHEIREVGSLSTNISISQFAGFTCECKPEFYGPRCEERKKCYTKSLMELCNHPQAECINQGNSYECLINASFDESGQNYATYHVDGHFKVHEIYVKYRSLTGGVLMSFETNQPGSPIADLQLNKSGLYLSGGPINRNGDIKFEELLDGNEREIRLALDTPTEIKSVTLSRQNDVLSDFQHIPFKGCLMQVRLNNLLIPFLEYGGQNHTIFNLTDNRLEVGPCKTCFEKDCQNDGHCDQDGYDRCVCPPTFTGNLCEIDVDECDKITCANGGTCQNYHGGFHCNCKEGYRGETCKDISDHCKAKQPCVAGTCKNLNAAQGNYQCECLSTHIGPKCDRRRDCKNECNLSNAQCINNVTCACLPGKREERTMCEFISKCEQIDGDLCLNGGLCRNIDIGGYYCDCPEPYYGHICEFMLEKSPYDIYLLIIIACLGFLVAALVVVGLVIFRSVRKARATRGTYSPSTQEKFGNSACDLLKPPQPERLI